jgi:hypothetical protein
MKMISIIEAELAVLKNADGIKASAQKDILAYGASLLARLASGEFGPPPEDEIVNVLSEYEADSVPGAEVLVDHYESIRRARNVEACIVSCMLCAQPSRNSIYLEKHERITAWAFLACLALDKADKEANQGVIEEGARRIRLMTTQKYQWMYQELPDFDKSIEGTHKALTELMTGLSDELKKVEANSVGCESVSGDVFTAVEGANQLPAIPRSRKQSIGHVCSLVKHYYKTLWLEEEGGEPGESIDDRSTVVSVSSAAGLDDGGVKFREWLEKGTQAHGAIAGAEFDRDRPIGAKYVEPSLNHPDSINRSRALIHYRASAMVNRIAMRNMANPSDWGVLTWFEATIFARAVTNKLNTSKSAVLGLFMLLAGRSADRVKLLILNTGASSAKTQNDQILFSDDRVAVAFSLNLPAPVGAVVAKSLLMQVKNTLFLRLPHSLLEPLRDLTTILPEDYGSVEKDLKGLIKELNDQYDLRLTIPRLCGFLRSQMRRRLDDPADASLICGETPDQCPALYYYAVAPERVVSEYRVWVDELMDAAGIAGIYPSCIPSQDQLIGSNTQFDPKYIKSLYKHLARAVTLLNNIKTKDYKLFHNKYMLYVYEVLSLAVGYRAVVSPLENIKDFDLIRRLLWISDKESHNGLAARIVPLPETAVEVIGAAIRHIERLAQYLRPYEPEIAAYLSLSASGDNPFLSMFDRRGELVPLRPSILTKVLKDAWPFALNWQRHFMRTHLRDKNVSGDLVNAWMGHSEFGEEALGPWSGQSIADLRRLELVIQEILSELDIEVIEGWQRYN